MAKGDQPAQRGLDRPLGRVAEPHLVERDGGEQQQRADLGADEDVLEPGREVRAEHADERHDGDDGHGEGHHGGLRVGRAVRPDQHVEVAGGHVGERADDEDAGGADRPAAHPAGPRPERARDPRERRAAVLVGAVHVEERRGDEEHRHEGRQQHGRRLHAGDHHDDPDHRRERVGRRRRREPDHQGVDEPDRVLLEAGLGCGFGTASSGRRSRAAEHTGRLPDDRGDPDRRPRARRARRRHAAGAGGAPAARPRRPAHGAGVSSAAGSASSISAAAATLRSAFPSART